MSALYSQLSAGVDRLKLFELPERDFHITRVVTGLESLMIRHDMAGQGQESDRQVRMDVSFHGTSFMYLKFSKGQWQA